ncbi:MAG: hypothetical protein GX072_02400 [Lysinibacillus sp.]|nr:hypothetical protein [Lysinibacillus sp.]
MTNYTKWMIGLVIACICITAIVGWTIHEQFFKAEILTVHEASKKIETLYGGTVESFEQKGDTYYMTLNRNNQLYHIEINATVGNVTTLKKLTSDENRKIKTIEEIQTLLQSQNVGKIEAIEFNGQGESATYIVEVSQNNKLKILTVHAITGDILSETTKSPDSEVPVNRTVITAEQAKQIALSQLKGHPEYTRYVESSDGGHYLVKIDSQKLDAIFQIHAISGKVISVTRHHKPTTTEKTTPQQNQKVNHPINQDDDDDDNDDDLDDDDDDDDD